MEILLAREEKICLILGEQAVIDKEYRRIKYIDEINVDDGSVVYNTLTAELLFLNKNELDIYNNPEKASKREIEPFVKKWLLVPKDCDETAIASQLFNVLPLFNPINPKAKKKAFTIIPTTDCNARCFYCYELGCNRRDMDEKTAHDVADYIIRNRDENIKLNLTWFGGEPLFNATAIDIICNDLKKANVDFRSQMVTNGYLFDKETVQKAKEFWNIHKVQITIDGTEEIYNRVKAFIYKNDVSPFKRVINNIENLLTVGIKVDIRMNMDEHNVEDLYVLTDFLLDKFSAYDNCSLYSSLLYEYCTDKVNNRVQESRHEMIYKQIKMLEYIKSHGKLANGGLKKAHRINLCMGDNDNTALILPNGELGKCEHYTDDHFYGSIYDNNFDIDMLKQFRKRELRDQNNCPSCEFRPLCNYLKLCLTVPRRCDEIDKLFCKKTIELQMLSSYEEYKKDKNQ